MPPSLDRAAPLHSRFTSAFSQSRGCPWHALHPKNLAPKSTNSKSSPCTAAVKLISKWPPRRGGDCLPDDEPRHANLRQSEQPSAREPAGRRCSKTSSFARRSFTSTTSASRSASCTRAARGRMATSNARAPFPELTRATVFAKKGKRTPVFCRFSTVAGSKGSKDTPRDVRGFAVKFYSDEGNWDLVGNNIPVFFIQDAIKFPDLIHSVKPEADRGFPQAASAHDTFWDFVWLMPESMHMIMWAMSDRALPRSLRMMEGFGVHTFRFVNATGESRFVKFHWRPRLGMQSTLWDEAVKISGADPDYHRRDLWEAITSGNPPEWDLGLQVFDEAFADAQPYDVLDATKLIPEEDVPLTIVGRLVLDRWPDNFFAETEQVAFLPSNVIPGIDFSDDPLLQGRLFSYLDTQKSRLGTANFHQIPVNAPKCPFQNFQRDGMMQTQVFKGRANYEPNSLAEAGEDGGPRESPQAGFVSAGRVALEADPAPQATDSCRAIRRPLQPGATVLPLADADRASTHCICAGVRAFEGGARACAHARACQPAQCRRGPRKPRRQWPGDATSVRH